MRRSVEGSEVARAWREGELTLRQIAGLTRREMDAVAGAAEALRRRGDLHGAAAVWGLLLSYDPLVSRYWRALADLQRRVGNWSAAVTCYEVLARVEDRGAESTYHEARCLRELGQVDLSRELLGEALSLVEPNDNPAWAATARRQLEQTPSSL
jgi:tetratricopeptide (TPR) repeat protein